MTTTCEVFQGEDCGEPAAITFRWQCEGTTQTLRSCEGHYSYALGDLLLVHIAPWTEFPKAAAA